MTPAATLRVMTCNVKYDEQGHPLARWSTERRAALTHVLRVADADVVALQEVLAHQLADLREDLPEYVAVGVGRDDGVAAGEHVPLLVRSSRWVIQEWGTFWLSDTPDTPSQHPATHFPRVCTWAALRPAAGHAGPGVAGAGAAGAALTVWNVHLDHESEAARVFGVRLVLERRRARPAERGDGLRVRDVLLGDLNASPGSVPLEAVLTAGLRDARAVTRTPPRGSGATFHDWDPRSVRGSGGDDPERIDHVLVGPGVTVLAYDVPEVDVTASVLPSDHYPVVVDLALTP